MKRGEVWWVEFGPSRGGEIRKKRPGLIVSNNYANAHLNRVQVVPLTSATTKLYPSECLITIKGKHSKAMTDQIMTVAKERLSEKISQTTPEEMFDLERVLALQLGFTKP